MRPRITSTERLFIANALRSYATHLSILAAELEADRWKCILAWKQFARLGDYNDWKLYQDLKPNVVERLSHHYDNKATVARLMADRFETMETLVNKRVHHKNTANLARDYLCVVPEYKAATDQ